MKTSTPPPSNFRAQRKGQNARQAMVISGLSTIYRNNTDTHFIQSQQRTEPRVYLLDISLQDMNKMYSKIPSYSFDDLYTAKSFDVFHRES